MSSKIQNEKKEIYLGQGSELKGPFSSEQVDAMRARGDLNHYSWIWEPLFGQWKALHAEPPAPPTPVKEVFAQGSPSASSIQVLCHDRINILAGSLTGLSERGCQFVSEDAEVTFKPMTPLAVNLLNPVTGQSANIQAKVSKIQKNAKGNITYQLEWPAIPRVLAQF